MFNLMTCEGLGTDVLGPCGLAWLAMIVIFFAGVFLRVVIKDMAGYEFSQLGGIAAGFVGYLIIITIFGTINWALLVGVVCAVAGGFLLGQILEV